MQANENMCDLIELHVVYTLWMIIDSEPTYTRKYTQTRVIWSHILSDSTPTRISYVDSIQCRLQCMQMLHSVDLCFVAVLRPLVA